jgi:hypothetical protein
MKKQLILLIVVITTLTVVFDACKKPKPEEEQETGNGKNITITFPPESDMLIVDLGDSVKAMQGVIIKNDKGKQITEGIIIQGLDEVGKNKELIYIVKENSGKVVRKSRPATVKADKLLGTYKCTFISRDTNWKAKTHNVLKNDTNMTAITIDVIWMGGNEYSSAVFASDKSMPYTLTFIDYAKVTTQSMYAKSRIIYGKVGDEFSLKTGFLEAYLKRNDQLMLIDTVTFERK